MSLPDHLLDGDGGLDEYCERHDVWYHDQCPDCYEESIDDSYDQARDRWLDKQAFPTK